VNVILKIALVAVLVIPNMGFSDIKESAFHSNTYDEAVAKETKLSFHGKSTKLGIITTDFDGYAKIFATKYERTGNIIQNIVITIAANSFDTNSSARDSKLNELCLDSKKFPVITGKVVGSIDLANPPAEVKLSFMVKGTPHEVTAKLSLGKSTSSYILGMRSSFSLKEWEIPDPSILVAHVQDVFELHFDTVLNSQQPALKRAGSD
jgi:polyisoprenoid-binding protein YceI